MDAIRAKQSQDLRQRLIGRILELHDLQDKVHPNDRQLLFISDPDSVLPSLSSTFLQNWLNQRESVIHTRVKVAKQQSLLQIKTKIAVIVTEMMGYKLHHC